MSEVYYQITKAQGREYITIAPKPHNSRRDAYHDVKQICIENELNCYVVNDIIFIERSELAVLYLHAAGVEFIEK